MHLLDDSGDLGAVVARRGWRGLSSAKAAGARRCGDPGLALCLAQRGCYMKPSDWTREDGGDTPEGPVTTLESLMWSSHFCLVTEPT